MAERFVGCQIWKRLRPPEVGPIKSQKIQAVVQAGFFVWLRGWSALETWNVLRFFLSDFLMSSPEYSDGIQVKQSPSLIVEFML